MKIFERFISLIILINIISQESYSQGGWVLQLVGTSPDSPRELSFINDNTGWMSAPDKILKTTNAGVTWSRQYKDTTMQFSDVVFINEITGYFTRYNGSVWKSTDGGSSWSIKLTSSSILTTIFFANAFSGWCAGKSGIIYNTTNGGENWLSQSSGSIDDLNEIYFASPETGWIVGNWGTIINTTNGGASWIAQNSNTVSFLNSVHFVTGSRGFACGTGGRILMTTNGGINWLFGPSVISNNLNSICFISELEGWAFGDSGTFLRTQNGGATWTQQNNGINLKLFSSEFTNGNLFLSAEDATVIRSTNSGINWTLIYRDIIITNVLQSVYFKNNLTGWSVGRSGILLKTINAGFTWELLNTGIIKNFNSTFFTSENEGWIVGGRLPPTGFANTSLDTTLIMRTINAGANWNIQFMDTLGSLNSIFFINSSYGWAVGRKGLIVKTTNGGINWTRSIIAANINAQKVFFTSINDGWVAYGGTSLYKTSNGGMNWTLQPIAVASNYNSIFFYNSMTGWTGATDGRICRTTNGGISWTCQLINIPFVSFYSLFFVTPELGWFVGRHIVKTTNGGVNWIQEYSPAGTTLYSVFFTPHGSGWACGANGTIIHKTEVIGINIISTEVPEGYFLHQNYPNPFNPVTCFKFEVPEFSNVELTVYDLLGKEIAALVNDKLNPGIYLVDWDASNFASGVYFYELKAGEFTQTKKLVLIK